MPSKAAPTRLGRYWLIVTVLASAGALVVAALLAPRRGAPLGSVLAMLLFVGYAMHVAASGWLIRFREVRACARRHRVRFMVIPPLLVVAGASLVPFLDTAVLECGLEAFFAWQLFHYTKQNVGIASLAFTSHGAGSLRVGERRSIMVAGWCGVGAFVARPALLNLRAVPSSPVLFHAATIGFVVAVVGGVIAFARRPAQARSFWLGAGYAVALCFTAPIYLVNAPYGAIGGMTIAHGLQYLILVSTIAVGPSGERKRWSTIGTLIVVTLVGAAAIHATSHLSASMGGARSIFGLYLGIIAAHFVTDAGLWKLRDPAARAFVNRALPDLVRVTSTPVVNTAVTSPV
jgi:hypothetical protein